jgi:hypothetical protein
VATIKEQDLFDQYPKYIPEEFRTSENSWMWHISVKTETQWAPTCPRDRVDVIDHTSSVTSVRYSTFICRPFLPCRLPPSTDLSQCDAQIQ